MQRRFQVGDRVRETSTDRTGTITATGWDDFQGRQLWVTVGWDDSPGSEGPAEVKALDLASDNRRGDTPAT